MQRTSFSDVRCSVARTLDIVGEWWTPLILRDIALGITRFDAIQSNLGVSRKVLTQRLQTLTDHDVIGRSEYQDNPPRHDYFLTDKGADLALVLLAMQSFGDKWIFAEEGAPLQWRHHGCGEISQPVLCCDQCGEQVRAGEATPVLGPGFHVEGSPPGIADAVARMQQLFST